jgi:hypothetical protein
MPSLMENARIALQDMSHKLRDRLNVNHALAEHMVLIQKIVLNAVLVPSAQQWLSQNAWYVHQAQSNQKKANSTAQNVLMDQFRMILQLLVFNAQMVQSLYLAFLHV